MCDIQRATRVKLNPFFLLFLYCFGADYSVLRPHRSLRDNPSCAAVPARILSLKENPYPLRWLGGSVHARAQWEQRPTSPNVFSISPPSLLVCCTCFCLTSQLRLLFTGAVSRLLLGHNAVYKTNITFGLKPISDNVGSLCLRDTVPLSQPPEVPRPSLFPRPFQQV